MRVLILVEENIPDLEKSLNETIEELESDCFFVNDIKFALNQDFRYALIMYSKNNL